MAWFYRNKRTPVLATGFGALPDYVRFWFRQIESVEFKGTMDAKINDASAFVDVRSLENDVVKLMSLPNAEPSEAKKVDETNVVGETALAIAKDSGEAITLSEQQRKDAVDQGSDGGYQSSVKWMAEMMQSRFGPTGKSCFYLLYKLAPDLVTTELVRIIPFVGGLWSAGTAAYKLGQVIDCSKKIWQMDNAWEKVQNNPAFTLSQNTAALFCAMEYNLQQVRTQASTDLKVSLSGAVAKGGAIVLAIPGLESAVGAAEAIVKLTIYVRNFMHEIRERAEVNKILAEGKGDFWVLDDYPWLAAFVFLDLESSAVLDRDVRGTPNGPQRPPGERRSANPQPLEPISFTPHTPEEMASWLPILELLDAKVKVPAQEIVSSSRFAIKWRENAS